MDNTISLSHDELQAACAEYIARCEAAEDPYAGYTGTVHVTPLMVDRILQADEDPV